MAGIFDSIGAWLKERTASPLYGIYIASFFLWNWKIVYVLFWEKALSVSKVEYVQKLMKFQGEGLFVDIGNVVWVFAPPMILTYLIVRWLPYSHGWAHKWSTKYYFDRKNLYDNALLISERKRKQTLEQLVKVKEGQFDSKEKILKSMSNEERWDEEFTEFQNTRLFPDFQQIITAVYEHGGYIEMNGSVYIRPDVLAITHSKGLVSMDGTYKVELTEKGKFFVSKFMEKTNYKKIF